MTSMNGIDMSLPFIKKGGWKILVVAITGLMLIFSGCHPDPDPDDTGLKISGVSLPSSIDVVAGGDITFTGNGFEIGDEIHLVLTTATGTEYVCIVTVASNGTVTFTLPEGVASGSYRISVVRGSESLTLGTIVINIITGINVPDKAGMTVKGVVSCDGTGIAGVTVSDGIEVTVTDEDGIYYLPSEKKHGYVFISVPGNYEVVNSNNMPQFYKRVSGGASVERVDFSLIATDNSNHVVLAMADWHLANRNNDLDQFANNILPDINTTISEYVSAGKKVYGLTLGDMSWDLYWYSNNFALMEYLPYLYNINCTVFNAMGNHDNDPYCAGDWIAEEAFRDIIGPTYYSFNLGNIHYVVLDDIQYINTGGSDGVLGSRNYSDIIIYDQMEWLKKDLATVADKNAPLVIAFHIQLHSNPTLDAGGNQVNTVSLNNGSTLLSALAAFSDVHILTGHTHKNYTAESGTTVLEHNTAAICATWWWTGKSGYAGNHVCTDGSPGGYGVYLADGTDLSWYYKSVGMQKNYQFRTYDLNEVYITAAEYAPSSTDDALAPYVGEYGTASSNNEVLINVWGYDPEWTVEVTEEGTPLTVERVYTLDPLHIISYEALRLNAGATPTESFVTGNTAHMFKAQATSATSSLVIKVTDRFGNIYTETMTRPKELTYLMQ